MKIATRALAGLCLSAVVAAGPIAAGQAQEQKQPASKPSGQSGDRRFWWRDGATVQELGLSRTQTDKIEAIWKTDAPPLRLLHDELEKLEREFNRLMKENTNEERVIALQIDRVEAVRSQVNRSRTVMLYRMYQVLTPAQYQKLTEIRNRHRKDAGRR